MSTDTPPSIDDEEADIFDQLYAKYGDVYEELAASDNPAAPLAQLVVDEARGADDA